tara:strand:+ start:37575 stop:37904 length:330 start_codon:yes stop_codon:yes gene_type:complete
MSNNKKIEIDVELDENNIPEKILWSSNDGNKSDEEVKAIFLSLWDSKKIETLKIDLWVKDMPLDHMKIFYYQILRSMSDTFLKATRDEKMSLTIKDFSDFFAEKMELKK